MYIYRSLPHTFVSFPHWHAMPEVQQAMAHSIGFLRRLLLTADGRFSDEWSGRARLEAYHEGAFENYKMTHRILDLGVTRQLGDHQLSGGLIPTITYDVNGGTPSVMNWTGSIAPGATQTITLDPITFTPNAGSNTLNVTASNPNGVADNTADNAGSSTFNVTLATLSNSIDVTLNLVTDRYGSETTWDVKNSGGATVYSGGPYGPDLTANGTTTQPAVPMTLAIDECYTFTIYDSYGDGIDSGYGVGSFEIVDDQSTVLVSGGDFAAEDQGLFKTPLAGLKDLGLEDVSVYPNPASDVLNVDFTAEGSDYTVAIMDLQGRVLATQTGTNVSFQVAEFAAGSYIVTISTDAGVYTENVVIK